MIDFGYWNMDCMDGMREFPDKYFDLAIVDPPYGIDANAFHCGVNGKYDRKKNAHGAWDNKPPDKEYFNELFRVSKDQIIWGGNYFDLPPARCFIVWDKKNISENFSMAMCEYAWTSFEDNAKIARLVPQGDDRILQCQKPIALYEWLLSRYANQGDIILDTHVGSASSLIACHNLGFKYVGFELDKDYYEKSWARLEAHKSQMTLWEMGIERR